jgi:hypothetical protein
MDTAVFPFLRVVCFSIMELLALFLLGYTIRCLCKIYKYLKMSDIPLILMTLCIISNLLLIILYIPLEITRNIYRLYIELDPNNTPITDILTKWVHTVFGGSTICILLGYNFDVYK